MSNNEMKTHLKELKGPPMVCNSEIFARENFYRAEFFIGD